MKTEKILILSAVVIGLVVWGRNAFAQSAQAGAKNVTRDGTLGASPINTSRVAATTKRSDEGTSRPKRRMQPIAFEGGAGSGAFQGPLDRLARNKYAASTKSATNARIRPDYAFNVRSGFALVDRNDKR